MVVLTYEISGDFVMTVIQLAFEQSLNGQPCVTTWAYAFNGGGSFPGTDVEDLITWFEASFVPLINALQSERITNVQVIGSAYGWPAATRTEAISGGGTVVAAGTATFPAYLPLYLRESVGDNFDAFTTAPYDGLRPIRRGGVYLSGLTEDWSTDGGAVVPGSLAAAFAAFQTARLSNRPVAGGSRTYYPAVWSYPRPALPPSPSYPDGKPARPALQAVVTGIDIADFTRLKSRKG